MLPYFLNAMEGFGTWRSSDGEFKIHGGGTVFCRTETDPDSIVGIPNVRAYWLDEAGKCRLYFRENIRARAASKGARGLNTTSPYSLNWVYKDVLKPLQAGLLPDTKLIQAASWENPYHKLHDVKERDKERARMDPRRFNMIYGGTFGRMDGLVYDCWDDAENLIQAFQFPPSTRFVGGIDWGYYPDPFTLKVRAITPDGKHYGVSEFVKTKLTPTDIAQVVAQKASVFGMKKIWADPSNPGMIEELNRQLSMLKIQCSVQGADNDIDRGVGLHYELIKTRKYKEFIGACPYSNDEREVYHYPEEKDLKPDQNSKDLKPVDQNNHCITGDALVDTSAGRIPMRDIRAGHRVLTRTGYRPVLAAWCTGERDTLELHFDNGAVIECTGNHEVYTRNRGFCRADTLRYTDVFVTHTAWLRLKSFFKESCLNATRRVRTRILEFTTAVRQFTTVRAFGISILRYGRASMGVSHRGTTSTTRTGTLSITIPPILNPFQGVNTFPNTCGSGFQTKWHSTRKGVFSGKLGKVQKPGMGPRRGWSGIAPMQRKSLESASGHGLMPSADNVGPNSWLMPCQKRPGGLSFVQTNAKHAFATCLGWITRHASAAFAVPSSFVIGTLGLSRADTRAVGLYLARPSGRTVPVYDLTVQDEHEFFANGVLVHNCMDNDRYITIMEYRSDVRHAPKVPGDQKRQETMEERLRRLRKRPSADSGAERW